MVRLCCYVLLYRLQKLCAEHLWHTLIGDDEVNRLVLKHTERLRATEGLIDLIVFAEHCVESIEVGGLIINDQHAPRTLSAPRLKARLCSIELELELRHEAPL